MPLDPLPLKDRHCLVTGAGNGIGRAIALAFADAGGHVACLDIDDVAAAATAAAIAERGARAFARRCDVSDERDARDAVAAAVDALGPARVLVNGAAPLDPTGSVLEIEPADWNRIVAINLTGAYLVSRAALPSMIAAGAGSIIHIASQMGRVGAAGRAAYCATKGALIQLAKVMAIDHAAQGVRVNSLSPGAVETGRMTYRFGEMEEARRAMGPLHVLGRIGLPGEIAAGAVFLASDASSFMTGADLLVDGGYTAI